MNKKILHLALSIGPTNSAYNELALPLVDKYKLFFFTYKNCDINIHPKIDLIQGTNSFIKNVIKLRKFIKKENFNVIHAHNVHMVLMCFIALIGVSKVDKPKTVCTIHTSYNNYKLRNKMLFFLTTLLFQEIVFCSKASYESFPKLVMNTIARKSHVIQNGVDTKRIEQCLQNEKKCDNSVFQIVSVGRLIELKNPIMLLEAFKQCNLDNARLVFVGGGKLEHQLKDKIIQLKLEDRVILKGVVERDKVYSILNESDLFISLSKVEGLPIAVLEAIYCECMGILSDIYPHQEINVDVNYVDIKNYDLAVQQCANLIKECYELNNEKKNKQKKHNKEKVSACFSVDNALKKYIAVYER